MNRWMSPPVAFVIAAVAIWLIGRSVEFGGTHSVTKALFRITQQVLDNRAFVISLYLAPLLVSRWGASQTT